MGVHVVERPFVVRERRTRAWNTMPIFNVDRAVYMRARGTRARGARARGDAAHTHASHSRITMFACTKVQANVFAVKCVAIASVDRAEKRDASDAHGDTAGNISRSCLDDGSGSAIARSSARALRVIASRIDD